MLTIFSDAIQSRPKSVFLPLSEAALMMATARHFTKLNYRGGSGEREMERVSNGSRSSGSGADSDQENSIDVTAELTSMTLAARNGSPSTIRKQSSTFLSATAASAAAPRSHNDDSDEESESAKSPPATRTDAEETTAEEGSANRWSAPFSLLTSSIPLCPF